MYIFIYLTKFLFTWFFTFKDYQWFSFHACDEHTHTVHNYADDHFKISSLAIHFAFASISEYSPYRGHNPP